MGSDNSSSDLIEISVPARPEYVVVVRLAAAGIAGRVGFSYDEIEDLKIAVAEGCTDAIMSGDGPINVRFDVTETEMVVSVAYRPAREEPPEERELGLFLIRCLMDDLTTSEHEGRRTMRMVKRVASRSPDGESN